LLDVKAIIIFTEIKITVTDIYFTQKLGKTKNIEKVKLIEKAKKL